MKILTVILMAVLIAMVYLKHKRKPKPRGATMIPIASIPKWRPVK